VNEALNKAWADIADLNTDAKDKRVVTLTIELAPDAERDIIQVAMRANAKLAKPTACITKVALARMGTGVVAIELPNRQLAFETTDNVTDIQSVKSDK
jgi:O-acetyl-ADP-ribose deacetylase (regulator of RNase III)